MNKEQKRYLKEIKALLPVYGKYEKRFFRDIKDSISELESENITYEFLCKELGRPEDLIVNYYQEIDSHYLRKQLKRSRIMKITIIAILILAIGLFICRMIFLYNLYLVRWKGRSHYTNRGPSSRRKILLVCRKWRRPSRRNEYHFRTRNLNDYRGIITNYRILL